MTQVKTPNHNTNNAMDNPITQQHFGSTLSAQPAHCLTFSFSLSSQKIRTNVVLDSGTYACSLNEGFVKHYKFHLHLKLQSYLWKMNDFENIIHETMPL